MAVRKCIYTNRDAKAKDSVLSKGLFPDLIHNWCNAAPVSEEYKVKKQGLTTELEMLANEYFHMIELHEMRVLFYKNKLSEIQAVLSRELDEDIKRKEQKQEIKKEGQVRNMLILKDVSEDLENSLRDFLASRLDSFSGETNGLTFDKLEERPVDEIIIKDKEEVKEEIKPKTIIRKKQSSEDDDDLWSE